MNRQLLFLLSVIIILVACKKPKDEKVQTFRYSNPNAEMTSENLQGTSSDETLTDKKPKTVNKGKVNRNLTFEDRKGLELPAKLKDRSENMLKKQGFAVSYNNKYN